MISMLIRDWFSVSYTLLCFVMFCIISVLGVILNVTMEGLDMVGINQYVGYSIEWDITWNPDTIYGRAKLSLGTNPTVPQKHPMFIPFQDAMIF